MRVLLDTHSFIWFVTGNDRLSSVARVTMESADNELLLSAASVWELSIKSSLGRIVFPCPLSEYIAQKEKTGFVMLPITWKHATTVEKLNAYHKDPFDRLLIAQALCEGVPIITCDAKIVQYGVNVIW